jgi:AcrR family transcriptional regulator
MEKSTRTSTRTRNPRGEGSRLAAELVDAAERLLLGTGSADAVSLRAITREAGVSAPSAYLHFPNKEAIVGAVVDRRFLELADRIRAAADGAVEPAGSLLAGCLAYCEFALAEPGGYRVLFATGMPDHTAPSSGQAAFSTLVEGVAGAVETGAAPPQDAFRSATLVWTGLHGLVMLRSARPAFPWPPLEELVADLLARVVGVSPAAGGPSTAPRS